MIPPRAFGNLESSNAHTLGHPFPAALHWISTWHIQLLTRASHPTPGYPCSRTLTYTLGNYSTCPTCRYFVAITWQLLYLLPFTTVLRCLSPATYSTAPLCRYFVAPPGHSCNPIAPSGSHMPPRATRARSHPFVLRHV